MIYNIGKPSDSASLTLVGSGIKFISHLTTEAKAYIQKSDIVLYLVNEPAMQLWIQKNNSNTEPLNSFYTKYSLRLHCYHAISEHILSTLREIQHVCVVIYGHPTVFAQPGLSAVKQARKEGFYANILPGISAEDCLFADLLINPGEYGCQSFESTDFLLRLRPFDPTSHLILWQIGMIGVLGHVQQKDYTKPIMLLIEYLLAFYPEKHPLIIYEAAQYPHIEPKIIETPLINLINIPLSQLSTLYIQPLRKRIINEEMLQKLGISKEDLIF